ncbi:hypothetical protein ACO2JO_06265 [Leptospira interrogans]
MDPPEQTRIKRHPQIVDDDDRTKAAMDVLEKEKRSLKDLVVKLSTLIIRRVIGKK